MTDRDKLSSWLKIESARAGDGALDSFTLPIDI